MTNSCFRRACIGLLVALSPFGATMSQAAHTECKLTFSIPSGAFQAVQFDVDYAASGGGIKGLGTAALCTSLVGSSLFAHHDDDLSETWTGGVITLTSEPAPIDLAECTFRGPAAPVPGDFTVTVPDSFTSGTPSTGGFTCGAPSTGSTPPYSRDALVTLQEAIGIVTGSTLCESDVNLSGNVTAIDSLTILRAAVGQPTVLNCDPCIPLPGGAAPSAAVSVTVAVSDCVVVPDVCGDGELDVDEDCDDGNVAPGDCCAADCTFEAAHSPCDNGDVCGGDLCDGAGTCVAGSDASSCDDGDPCTHDTCSGACSNVIEPDPACLAGTKSELLITDSATASKDFLKWTLNGGPALLQLDLGTPITTTSYTLCVYDTTAGSDTLAMRHTIDPGLSWTSKDPKGFVYKDKTGASDGFINAQIKTGIAGKSKLSLTLKGLNLTLSPPVSGLEFFNQDPRVTVQLHNSATSACQSAAYSTAKINTASKVKLKTP